MKALFKGTCSKCNQFVPRCATVYMRLNGKATEYHQEPVTICAECRLMFKGKFRMDAKHKWGKTKA